MKRRNSVYEPRIEKVHFFPQLGADLRSFYPYLPTFCVRKNHRQAATTTFASCAGRPAIKSRKPTSCPWLRPDILKHRMSIESVMASLTEAVKLVHDDIAMLSDGRVMHVYVGRRNPVRAESFAKKLRSISRNDFQPRLSQRPHIT